MSKEERDKQSVSQDISDAAEAKLTGELSEQDLAKVDGGRTILGSVAPIGSNSARKGWGDDLDTSSSNAKTRRRG